jgi:outer membrane protein OmpA-like peptidoglycan-associated protein
VLFDVASSNLKPEASPAIANAAALSMARATAVRDALRAAGVNAGLLRVRGHGARRPVAPNDTPAGKRAIAG